MGFHEYSTIWMLHKNEVLHARMELTNKKEKLLLLWLVIKALLLVILWKEKVDVLQKPFSTFYRQASIMGAAFVLLVKLSIKEMV